MTRRRSSSAGFGALAWLLVTASASGQSAEEAALRARYGVAAWPSGATRPGVALARLSIPGLALRARTDRLPGDGGITLDFGAGRTTLRVRIAVAAGAIAGRDALVGFLRGAQADLVPLGDPVGADVALGDTPRGAEVCDVLAGNVAVSIERTREAGRETPSAVEVWQSLRPIVAAAGPLAMPALTLRAQAGHVDLAGAVFEHVEATARGGHLRGRPSPAGVDYASDGPGPVEIRVIATDPLGRSATASIAAP